MVESLYMAVKYKINQGQRDLFLEALKKNNIEQLSAEEKGNICYQYCVPESTRDEVLLREVWKDENAQKQHVETEHFKKLGEIKEDYVRSTQIKKKSVYAVHNIKGPINGNVVVPGSKSMTNRALLLAALSTKRSHLSGVLFSDDSRHFLGCLTSLGYDLTINESDKTVNIKGEGTKIPNKTGTIDVGSAGTAARFLTALLALSDGTYTIQCSEQMKARPMKPLFDALTEMGAQFRYLEKDGYLPCEVTGNKGRCSDVKMSIEKSTQFLSALLMVTPVTRNGCRIHITSDKKDGAYIRITRKMMESFGAKVEFDGQDYYIPGNQEITVGDYYIEPDVSAACYFYAIAALTGGKILVKNVYADSMQGDMKFVELLKELGCVITETSDGICVQGPEKGIYQGIDVDMNDFSDQALTLAALAAFAKSRTIIRNVAHIKGQECDRIQAIIDNLTEIGVKCTSDGNDIIIDPLENPKEFSPVLIKTFEDHRVAMAFTLTGLRTKGIFIENPLCCRKTFENYYDVLEKLLKENEK